MRLIDADKLIDALEDYEKYPIADEYNLGIAKAKMIAGLMPTAYDVDKVVEKISNADCDRIFDLTDIAIDIVKRGGIE